MRLHYVLLMIALLTAMHTQSSLASVTVFTNKPQWQNAVGNHDFIGFTEYPELTTITTQYQSQGITFTDGNDAITESGAYSDNHGLFSADIFGDPGTVHIDFARDQYAFGIEFTDFVKLELYQQDRLIYSSATYVAGFTPFVGLISTQPFDRLVALDPTGFIVTIDNIYFNAAIPAPGALTAFAIATLIKSRRRRRD